MLLAEALAAAASDIDPVLVSPAAVARVVGATRALSDEAVAAYIECRADPADEQADLLACFLAATAPRPATSTAGGCSGADGWSLAEAVQLSRRTPGSELHGVSPLIWLEFDDAGRSPRIPEPSVCVCVEPTYLARIRYRDPNPSCEAMAGEVAALAAVDEASVAAVVGCIRALPAEGRLIHFSLMCARVRKATKLYTRVPLADVAEYLDEIGWCGDGEPLGELIEWRRPTDRFLHIDISIEHGRVVSRLGVAFPRGDDGQRFNLEIFAGLAARALSPQAADRVMEAGKAWVRTEPTVKAPGGWTHIVHRWIDQKIVVDRDKLELKLYLAVRPLPFLFGALATVGGR